MSVRAKLAQNINSITLLSVIIVAIIGFLIVHANMPNAPGQNPNYPLGWWGGFDQGHYLNSTQALREGDLDPQRHFYPPLYSLFGAVFFAPWSSDPFIIYNIGLLAAFCIIFYSFARRYLGPVSAALVLIAGIGLYGSIRALWVMPWTSTLAAPLIAAAYLLIARFFDFSASTSNRTILLNAFGFGMVVGLIVPTRPIDLSVVVLPCLAYAAVTLHRLVKNPIAQQSTYALSIFAGIVGVAIPVAGYLIFNIFVFGELSSQYMTNTENKGFFLFDIPDQLYSHLFSSQSFYGENNADWFSNIPIIFFALFGAGLAILSKIPLVLRLIAASFFLQICLYYGFSDIIPTGTFRYHNIHYFKWGFPFLLLICAYLVKHYLGADNNQKKSATISVAIFTLVVVSIDTTPEPVQTSVKFGPNQNYILNFEDGKTIDFVDISNVRGSWPEVYFGFDGVITSEGSLLRPIKNYRFFPIENGVRLMFVRPLKTSELDIALPNALRTACFDDMTFQPGHVRYGLSLPLLQQNDDGLLNPTEHHPAKKTSIFNFAAGGASDALVDSNWSLAEPHWRWMEGKEAGARLDVSGFSNSSLILGVNAVALGPSEDTPVISEVIAGDQKVGEIRITQNGYNAFNFHVPKNLISANNILDVKFRSENPKSPGGSDYRLLSIGIVNLKITTACD